MSSPARASAGWSARCNAPLPGRSGLADRQWGHPEEVIVYRCLHPPALRSGDRVEGEGVAYRLATAFTELGPVSLSPRGSDQPLGDGAEQYANLENGRIRKCLIADKVPVGIAVPIRQLFAIAHRPSWQPAELRLAAASCPCTFGDGSRVVSQFAGQLA